MVAGSILVLAAAVFVPGVLVADAVYRTRPGHAGLDATALFVVVILGIATAAAGTFLLLTGASAGRQTPEGEGPGSPEKRLTAPDAP
jgi:hypothetical protein